ncbi:MAG: arylsulfatase [Polyangiales bacterium]
MKQSRTLRIASALGVALALGCQSKEAAPELEKAAPAETPAAVEKPELSRGDGEVDRTILPIVPPKYEPITELDARKAKAPPPFEIKPPEGAPNVVIVLIDDIGFGATETFGGVIETPTLSRLAEEGLRFNQFHTTALCSPTRASLKSGRNHHATNVGSVMEIATGFPGNQGQIPPEVIPMAEILRQNGYSTGAFGKWHETAPWEVSASGPYDRWPTHQGFDKFYGFIGGETNQWDPAIFDGNTRVPTPKTEGYHFTTDMTDQAINWVRSQQALTPEKPFMVYFATGAVHAPHHVGKEWIEKHKGKFDDGWDKLRETTLERQKAMGLVPKDTRLTPLPPDIQTWDDLSAKEKKLFALQMEVFAAFTEQTDHEVGRLVDAIGEIGQLDNTLFVYIMGDNGSSAEGGLTGTFNELVHLNGIFEAETIDSMLARADDWGGPNSFPHMAAGWAVATDSPFMYTKQVAGDYGGTRNGMVLHWPKGFKSKGEIRSQWHHVNDVAPTILEAAKLPTPKVINGVEQRPMDGVSMLYCLDDADAEDRHKTQYFEMFGNRGIYHDGWLARVNHRAPWRNEPFQPLEEDIWELYDTRADFSLFNDLSKEHPEKLKEMQALFEKEAIANSVYPIDDRSYERFNAKRAGRPDLMGDRTSLTLFEGMEGLTENAFLNVKNTSLTIEADVELSGKDRGVILAQGGKFGGWVLYMDKGRPTYTYNWFGLDAYTVQAPKPVQGKSATIKLDFEYDGDGFGKGGVATIFVNDKNVAEGRIEKTQPNVFSADETADVGRDEGTEVVPLFKSIEDSKFTGHVKSVTVSIRK